MSSTWDSLSQRERFELYRRRYQENTPVETLAAEIGDPPISLNRRLQEFRRDVEGLDDEALQTERVSIAFDDLNSMSVSIEGVADDNRVKSLDDLLVACQVDQKEWLVESHMVNTWEGFRKEQQKDIAWVDGVANGYTKDTGNFRVVTLFQVKAKLVRREPVALEPVISQVRVAISEFPTYTWRFESPAAFKRALIIPDLHIGYKRDLMTGKLDPLHDRVAMSLVLQAAALIEFDEIILLGDVFDLSDWSDKFIQSPEYYQVTQPALEEAAWFLGQLRARQPKAKIYFIEGNHEKRLRDAMVKHVPQGYGLRQVNADINYSPWSIPFLLGLKDLDIEWVGNYPDGTVWLEKDIACVHGLQLSAEKAVLNAYYSVIFGHIHRYESASRAIYDGDGVRNVYAYSPGFLGRMDGIIPGVKAQQRWSLGFGIVAHAPGLDPTIQHISIRNGRALIAGSTIYEGADYVDQLNEDLKGRWKY